MQKNERFLYILMPITIPGSGKTFIKELLLETYILESFYTISNDDLRVEIMEELSIKNPDWDRDLIFKESSQLLYIKYNEMLISIIKKVSISNSVKNYLYLDKNHLPGVIEKTINLIKENCIILNIICNFSAIIPLCKEEFILNSEIKFPFSINFLINCILRVQNRKTHQTLKAMSYKSVNIILGFINGFRNFSFDFDFLNEKGIDNIIRIPMNNENYDIYNENIKELFSSLLKNDNKFFDYEFNKTNVLEFLEKLEKQNYQIKFVEKSEILSTLKFLFN